MNERCRLHRMKSGRGYSNLHEKDPQSPAAARKCNSGCEITENKTKSIYVSAKLYRRMYSRLNQKEIRTSWEWSSFCPAIRKGMRA